MAAGLFVEEDAAGDTFTVSCAAGTPQTTPASRAAAEGGTAGSLEVTLTLVASTTDRRTLMFSMTPGGTDTWAAGNWTVPINVTTAGVAGMSWASTFICRVNSGGVNQATIGSLTGQAITFNTAGVVSMTISGASQTPAAGDKVYIVLGFTNTVTMGKTFGVTPSQTITSPFTGAVAVSPVILMAQYVPA
jgi:hypothetical protein